MPQEEQAGPFGCAQGRRDDEERKGETQEHSPFGFAQAGRNGCATLLLLVVDGGGGDFFAG